MASRIPRLFACSCAWALAVCAPASATLSCEPASLNVSAAAAGGALEVSPLPGSRDASRFTQISIVGAPAQDITHVSVLGSRSGDVPGRLEGYSQGDGASFVLSHPLSPGENVTVKGLLDGSRLFAFSFRVLREDTGVARDGSPRAHSAARYPLEVQHFYSRPGLQPPSIDVTRRSPQEAPGDIFTTPYSGVGASGPAITEPDGELVWFDPLPAGIEATNLQVQDPAGQPLLTWWQGRITPQGFGEGSEVIDNERYQRVGTVRAGNGYLADLHDFHLLPSGRALLTVFNPVECDLAPLGGPASGAVTDSIFQEIDTVTGLVRREWTSLDHVGVAESYSHAFGTSRRYPFDYFHINSVDQAEGSATLISGRNTSALYQLSTASGQVLTRIGGRHSTIALGPGAQTAYQHDATVQPDGDITVFDNGGVPRVHSQSRAIVIALEAQGARATLLSQFEHPSPLASGSQGSAQLLEDGDLFVGWGSRPYMSEFSASGAVLYDAHMHRSYQSYRAYRFAWSGQPASRPSVAVSPSGRLVFASWNGDTRTSRWEVLAGSSPHALSVLSSTPRTGFETRLQLPSRERYVQVVAIGAEGTVLAGSPVIAG